MDKPDLRCASEERGAYRRDCSRRFVGAGPESGAGLWLVRSAVSCRRRRDHEQRYAGKWNQAAIVSQPPPEAFNTRSDLLAAESQHQAAKCDSKAAVEQRLPEFHFDGYWAQSGRNRAKIPLFVVPIDTTREDI